MEGDGYLLRKRNKPTEDPSKPSIQIHKPPLSLPPYPKPLTLFRFHLINPLSISSSAFPPTLRSFSLLYYLPHFSRITLSTTLSSPILSMCSNLFDSLRPTLFATVSLTIEFLTLSLQLMPNIFIKHVILSTSSVLLS